MRTTIDYIGGEVDGYYITLYVNGEMLVNEEIDTFLSDYSNFTYKELALQFGGFTDYSSDFEEIYFETRKDAERMQRYLISFE